jgi:phospholipid/cholesterol/gamma-HCH transport system ATP-binding protein
LSEELAISLRGIRNSFGSALVHENLNLDIKRGEALGLIGGSGSGKSVLLRTIIGLNKQSAGEVTVMGINLTRAEKNFSLAASTAAWQNARRRWGVLFQDGALFSSLTVRENIELPLRVFYKFARPLLDEVAGLKLRLVGLPPDSGEKYPSELSGGMRKRAALARALAMDPAILLLDEPTAGLDPIAAAAFDSLINTLRKALGLTVVMITHDIDSLYAVCDRTAVLAEKRILAVGSLAELLRLNNPWVREYFSGVRGRSGIEATS